MLDTVSEYETPEGAVLRLRPAGVTARALAWLIDLAIRMAVLMGASIAASLLGGLGAGFYLIFIFLLDWFYNVFFEVKMGATPGKRRMGLAVVMDNGAPITWSASLLRNLLRVVDFLPMAYGFGLISSLFHGQSKRLGDIAAGTLVVYQNRIMDHDLAEALRNVDAVAAPRPLDYETQQALLAYAERAPALSPARRVELAEILQPLHTQQGEAAVHSTLAYARQVAGKA